MKKKLLSIIAFMLCAIAPAAAQGTYAVAVGEAHEAGDQITSVDNITLTFGATGDAAFKAGKANNGAEPFVAFTEGNGGNPQLEGGLPISGTFYKLEPLSDGTILIGVVLNNNKSFYITDGNGKAVKDFDGIKVDTKYYGTYTFNVVGGETYYVYCTGSKLGFYGFEYTLAPPAPTEVSVSVGVYGFASFSSAYALDFTNAQYVEAYVATSCAEGVVNMTKVNQVPAATGVVLKSVGDGASTENIKVVTGEVAAIATNYLKPMVEAGDIAASAEGAYNYVFGVDGWSNVGFFKADATYTSEAGRAYLQTTEDLTPTASTAAKGVMMVFGGETTGITQLNAAANAVKGTYYTLSGLRVEKPTKGLYILNGKKVVVK